MTHSTARMTTTPVTASPRTGTSHLDTTLAGLFAAGGKAHLGRLYPCVRKLREARGLVISPSNDAIVRRCLQELARAGLAARMKAKGTWCLSESGLARAKQLLELD